MIRVFFDNTEVSGNYLMRIKQNVDPYNQSFKLGVTICRQFEIDVKNNGFSSVPDRIYLYEDETGSLVKYATLLVDSTENSEENYTTFHLTDMMVRFNQNLSYSTSQTILQILNSICQAKNISLVTQDFFMKDFVLSWDDELYERDLISYVAEVNGGYAYIDNNGDLVIEPYRNISVSEVDIGKCSSYKVGDYHQIGRVYVELASATHYYPESTNKDTVYLNPDNILFTDSQGFTIESTIRSIYNVVNGFAFYNIEIGQCPVLPDVRTGQLINVGNWARLMTSGDDYIVTSSGQKILVTDGLLIPFLCTIDWEYKSQWIGGYETHLECKIQEETKIVTAKDQIRRVSITVDRELGVISQQVSAIDDEVGEVSASLELKIDKTDNDQIISMINASADNIILNTKSLIFGIYPDGQYIEVKNYYYGTNPIGVLFTGNGEVRFESSGEYYINNKNGSQSYNTFDINGNSARAYSELTNYDASGEIANQIQLDTYTNIDRQTITIANNHRNSATVGNELLMSTNSSGETIQMSNYDTSGDLVSSISLNDDQIWIAKYTRTGTGSYTPIASISISSSGDINLRGSRIFANGGLIG